MIDNGTIALCIYIVSVVVSMGMIAVDVDHDLTSRHAHMPTKQEKRQMIAYMLELALCPGLNTVWAFGGVIIYLAVLYNVCTADTKDTRGH